MKHGIGVALLLAAALFAPPARGAAGASCSLATTPLAFGKYLPTTGSPADFTATITVSCTASGGAAVPVHGVVTLVGADGPAGRLLANGAHRLRYQLYADPARTIPWSADGAGGAVTISGVADPSSVFRQTLTVYGRVLARQSSSFFGLYTDQITAVLNY